MKIPETVVGESERLAYEGADIGRDGIKTVATGVDKLRQLLRVGVPLNGEANANATIAFRHLEDASMRLGKVMQALDGGVTALPNATKSGA